MKARALAAALLATATTLAPNFARADEPATSPPPAAESAPSGAVKVVRANYSLAIYAGLSTISYKENGYLPLSELAVTPKISYRLLLPITHFDFGLSGYGTGAALTSNQPGVTARFFGLNARVGYGGFEILPYPWKFSLMGGFYYTTMSVQGAPFGFTDLMGPQIYPALRYALGEKDTLSGAFKFSPIGTLFSTSDREIALNFAWTRALGDTDSLTLALDLADLRFANEDSSAVSQSGTISLGYGW